MPYHPQRLYCRQRAAPQTLVKVGIHRLVMKAGSDNFRSSAIQGIMQEADQGQGIEVVMFSPPSKEKTFFHSWVIRSLEEFKA